MIDCITPSAIFRLTSVLAALSSGAAPAEPAAAAPSGPLVAYAWSGEPERYPHVVPMYWVIAQRDLRDPSLALHATDAMPEGHRVLFLWDFARAIDQHPEDCCRDQAGNLTATRGVWWDRAAEQAAESVDDWFSRYRESGGRVDTVVLDWEANFSNWALGEDVARYRAIEGDSRFESIAKELGFRDLELVRNWRSGDSYQKWNALMDRRQAEYFNTAIFEPIRRHFPDARFSNYGYGYCAPDHVCPDRNGYEHSRFGIGAHVGTHQSIPAYGWLGNLRKFHVQADGFELYGNGPEYGASPFAAFRLSVNQVRSARLSSAVPLMPWISHKRFAESWLRESDLYQELILHCGLTAPDALLLWNPRRRSEQENADHHTSPEQDQLLSDCLVELNDTMGDGPRETLVAQLAGWGADHVLTGMRCGRRNIWRFTPLLTTDGSADSMIVREHPPKFQTAEWEITFADGSIHRPEHPVSNHGIWIIVSADARPDVKVRE
jgi:hypothetical protein